MLRMLCADARVDAHRLRTGNLQREGLGAPRASAYADLSSSHIFIDDSASVTPLEMRAKCRRLKAEHGLGLIIVDYLQLVTGGGRIENRQQEISSISRSLKGLAKELGVPVIALSQLSRAPEARTDHRPQLSDLRESGAIEQDADIVMFIYREEEHKPTDENRGIAEIIIGKQRNGPTGSRKLAFIKEFTRFENLEWKSLLSLRPAAAPGVDLDRLAANYDAVAAYAPRAAHARRQGGRVRARRRRGRAPPRARGCDAAGGRAIPRRAPQLRDAGDRGATIVVLAGFSAAQVALLARQRLTPIVSTRAQADALCAAAARRATGRRAREGRHRACRGSGSTTARSPTRPRACPTRALEVEGAMTHLACADESAEATERQLDRFDAALAALARRGLRPPLVHAANSAGLPFVRADAHARAAGPAALRAAARGRSARTSPCGR